MSSVGVATLKQINLSQVFSALWVEFGSELVLLALFCAGFTLFRITTIRELIPGSQARRGTPLSKAELALKVAPPAEAASVRRPGSLSEADEQSSRPTKEGALRQRSIPSSTLQRTRSTTSESGGSSTKHAPGSVGANVVLAGRTGDLELLQQACQQVVSEGSALPANACEVLLRHCASSADSNGPEMFDQLIRAGFEPSEGILTAVVSLCAEARHVRLAEHTISYVRRTGGRVTLALYSALMKVYGHARLWHKTCDLFESMKLEGVMIDTVAYGSLIKAAVESGRNDLARQLFKESGNPDLLNYMSMIRAAGREHDVPKAMRLLEELERSPLPVDATAYNCALEACAACNDRTSAEVLFKRMSENDNIDVVSYNTYLKVLLYAGAREEVARIFREMRGRDLAPNVVTYNSLVRDAIARQDTARAWSLVGTMEQAGVMPDAFTCSILMKSVKHSPCPDDVDRIIDLIQRTKVIPDEVLVNCLLDACVRLRDTQRLTKVLQQFRARGVVPSPHAYATLIRAYGHARRVDRAWELWHELTGGEGSAGGSEEAFAAMVEACLAGGDLQGAVGIFREAGERLQSFARAPSVFSAIVKACLLSKQQQLAIELYSETKDLFVCGRVSFNTMIDAFVRSGDTAKATELFRDMALKNVTPDLITYSTLIKGHCSRGDLEQGLQLLGLMQRRGIAPDAVLFNSILDGCAHKQMRTLTEQVLRDMEAAEIAPSNFTLSILAKLYGRCGDLDAAFHAVEYYPERYGFSVNAQVFTSLMSACIANGALPRAVEVFERMAPAGAPPDAKTFQTLLSGGVRASDVQLVARLLQDALSVGLASRLESEVLDAALLLVARRGQAAQAADLASELRASGAALSQRALRAALESAAGDCGTPMSRLGSEDRAVCVIASADFSAHAAVT